MKYYGYTYEGITYWLGPISKDNMRRMYDIFRHKSRTTVTENETNKIISYIEANKLMDIYYRR
jgi:hypothetical protein